MSAVTRHLVAAERALDRVRHSMYLAEPRLGSLDLSEGWRALEALSLILQAERFAAEVRDEEPS